MGNLVNYRIENSTAIIEMNDGKANTQKPVWLLEMNTILDELEQNSEVKAIVLQGRPGFFSAGLDLKLLPTLADQLIPFLGNYAQLHIRLYQYSKPIVAACTGHAIAGGAFTLLTVDYAIGIHGSYKIGLSEVPVGIPLPKILINIAREKLARQYLTCALLAGSLYTPEQTLAAGYFQELSPADSVLESAIKKAGELGQLPKQAFQQTKEQMRKLETYDYALDFQRVVEVFFAGKK